MKKAPNVWTVEDIQSYTGCSAQINGQWLPARPIGFFSIWYRIKCAWMVFIGKYDALKWPGGQ